MAEQLGVERADDQRAARGHAFARAGAAVEAGARARDEVGGVAAGEGERGVVVVGAPVVAPRVVVVDGVVVVVAVGAAGGVARIAPHELDRRAVDRHEREPGVAEPWPQVLVGARAEAGGELHARAPRPRLTQDRRKPGRVGALGQPEAAGPRLAEARPVRGHAAVHLHPRPGIGGEQRQYRMRRRGGPLRVGREAREQVAAARLQALERALVVAVGALELAGQLVVPRRAQPGRVLGVGAPAYIAHEGAEALGDPRRLELVAQHGRERQRDRRILALEHVEQREVGGGHRLEQPLLAERPGAKALDVGHVRVQDDRERAALAAPPQPRHTARKSSARSKRQRAAGRSTKSLEAMAGTSQP